MKMLDEVIAELPSSRQKKIEQRKQELKLGIRAERATGWKWMAGMAYYPGDPHLPDTVWRVDTERDLQFIAGDEIPVLSDPATKGCLIYLVRAFHDLPRAWVVYRDDIGKWAVCWSGATHGGDLGVGDTEEEALVAALEGKSLS
jgi:hypothetical protein